MDESWRMRMGKPASAACFKTRHTISGAGYRSTDEVSHRKSSENPLLEADDFNDVFGGPPRTVISRQFSGNEYFVFPTGGSSSSSSCFYEDVFQPKEKLSSPSSSPARGRKSLPEFLGPAERGGWRSDQFEGFYGDIFGWKEEETKRSRSRFKSKMGSSWVVSSEDMSPSQPATGAGVFGDDDIALLASKLRSINVSRRWHSNEPTEEDIHKEYDAISSNYPSSRFEYDPIDNIIKSSNNRFRRKNPSPEDTYPPSSVAYSLSKDHEAPVCGINQERGTMQGGIEAILGSYVVEINGNQGKEDRDDAIGVEDAIAWAKEKFQTYCSLEELHTNHQFSRNPNNLNDESTSATEKGEESDDWSSAEDKEQTDNNMEMELLNEKIRLWSSGKEADIRLLLSTLHHILWEDNHWVAVSITNLLESKQVKKVYQTARLLLHPDKLQQKGATCMQKYLAHKAFPILQDAWAAFLSQDDIKK